MGNLVLRVNNKYQLDLRLGSGSFGEVYQGEERSKDLVTNDSPTL